jgi:protein involved in polysaccharide export with SLBB domain
MVEVLVFLLCAGNETYLLPNDAVEVKIWRREDLSAMYYVDDDTSVTIPLLGKLSIKDLMIDSLHTLLMNNFENYYTDVYIDVDFYYRINIFGEVKQPGYYYVRSEDNLANLLAQAGGPTERGSLSGITILNLGEERKVDFTKTLKGGSNVDELNLKPGDVVIVPRRFMPAFQEWSVLFSLGTLILQIYIAAK